MMLSDYLAVLKLHPVDAPALALGVPTMPWCRRGNRLRGSSGWIWAAMRRPTWRSGTIRADCRERGSPTISTCCRRLRSATRRLSPGGLMRRFLPQGKARVSRGRPVVETQRSIWAACRHAAQPRVGMFLHKRHMPTRRFAS